MNDQRHADTHLLTIGNDRRSIGARCVGQALDRRLRGDEPAPIDVKLGRDLVGKLGRQARDGRKLERITDDDRSFRT